MSPVDALYRDMWWLFTEDGRSALFAKRRSHLWSEEEDNILIDYFPNYSKLAKLLPTRSQKSCLHRAITLRLHRTSYRWTEQEVAWLRKNYATALWEEILTHLPRRSENAISKKANELRLFKSRRDPPLIGVYIIDEIKARAKELNFSIKDLDEEAGRRSYFKKMRAKAPPQMLRIAAIEAAVSAMGGRIVIEWSDG